MLDVGEIVRLVKEIGAERDAAHERVVDRIIDDHRVKNAVAAERERIAARFEGGPTMNGNAIAVHIRQEVSDEHG